jgi:ATP-binding cassette, subfamily F, member 3
MGSSAAEANARTVLLGLGFSEESIEQPVSRLSGGWRTRCSLASALCQNADLLLLDEPTNFLDLPSIIWLERYIQNLSPNVTVLVVTHDRAFADGVGEELLVMRNLTLERFRGNVSAYEIERAKKYKYLSRMKEAQDKQKKHIESTIEKNVKAAKRAGDDKKLKQAASRKKKLDERWGMEVGAKGGRFKLNRDLQGWHNSNREGIEIPDFEPPVQFTFPNTPADLRFPGALLSMEKVTFAYPKNKKAVVLQDVDLTIHPGERIGIAGKNGSGKSTLVSLAMAGADGGASTMKPTSGTISRHTRARIGLYSQHSAEELNTIAAEKPDTTALAHLMEYTDMAEKDARGLLSGLGLPGRTASDVPIALLSGGQKVRLALAKLLWTPPHLLILDEVTTHLDSDAIQALVVALRSYEGALLVVTHDRFFMRCVVEGESPKTIAKSFRPEEDEEDEDNDSSEDEDGNTRVRVVYRMIKGRLKKLEGGMLQYEELAAKASTKMGKS